MKKIMAIAALLFAYGGFAQCPTNANLSTSSHCLGGVLQVTTPGTFSRIVWFNGNTPVDTALAFYNADGGITVAGGNGNGSDPNQLLDVEGVYVDSSGNVYVADGFNNRVQKWAPGATSGTTVAGGNGTGSDPNQLKDPQDVKVDRAGNIYVLDAGNGRVQKWAPGATSGTTVAGPFTSPHGLFLDASGNLYVTDGSNVYKWTPGATSGTIVAGGNGSGAAANQLAGAYSVFVDGSGNVYVSDLDNQRVQKWAPGATSGITVAGGNGWGTAANQLEGATGVVVDAAGNVFVCDPSNLRIQEWAPGATSGITIAGAGGPGPTDQIDYPTGLWIDAKGNLYVGAHDNFLVEEFPLSPANKSYKPVTAGTYTALLSVNSGNPVPGSYNVDGAITVAGGNGNGSDPNQLLDVEGVYVDHSGNIYVADGYNNRVQKWAPGATSGTTVAGGNGPGSDPNQLKDPQDVKVDRNGNIYVLDAGNGRVQKWAPGATSGTTVASPFTSPRGLFLGAGGHLYVTDGSNVYKWTPGATSGTIVAGGNGSGAGANQLAGAYSVFVDGSGNVYVSDAGNQRVQKWAPGATSGITVAGGNGWGTAANQLEGAAGVVVDATGNVFVCDPSNLRVQEWTPGATSGITVAGGDGQSNQIDNPTGLWIDAKGNLYVGDHDNFRVAEFLVSPPNNSSVNSCHPVRTNAITIHGSVTPSVSITASDTLSCSGSPLTFTASPVDGGSSPTYRWLVNGKHEGADKPSFTSKTLDNADTISCVMISNATCASPDTVLSNAIVLVVAPQPHVSSEREIDLPAGQSVVLNLSVEGDIAHYLWTPGTGLSDSTIADPVAEPLETTVYTLHVWTPAGCEASGHVKVHVAYNLKIPNAFTPNGDGKNDVFYVLGAPAGSMIKDFVIFDRHGNRVFQEHDVQPDDRNYGWNGNIGGRPASPDTYLYTITMRFADGIEKTYRGTVLLIRNRDF